MRGGMLRRSACLAVSALLLFPAARVSRAADADVERTETVYVTADAAGTVESVLSSVYLVNPDQRETLADGSSMTEVKNILSNDSPWQQDGAWVFPAEGEDVCYKGKASSALPVSMNVRYALDGTEMSPEEIAGRSGRVRVTVSYENRCKSTVEIKGEPVELFTPFTVITIIELGDGFRRVAVENAKIMSEAGSATVIGTTFPGLAHNLDTDATDSLAESFSFEADVKSFSLESIMAVMVPDLLDSDDLKSMDDVRDFVDGVDELNDAGDELQRGAKRLHSGMKQFTGGLESFLSGLDSLKDAANQLNAGLGAVDTSALNGALSSVGGKIGAASGKVQSAAGALSGMDLTGMTDAQKNAVNSALSALSDAGGALSDAGSILSGIQAPDLSALTQGVSGLAGGLASLAQNGGSILDAAVSLRKGLWSLYKGIRQFCDEGLKELDEQTEGMAVSVDRKDAMLELSESYTAYSAPTETVSVGSVKFIVTTDSIYVPKVEAPVETQPPAAESTPEADAPQDREEAAVFTAILRRLQEFILALFGGN